MKTIRLDEDFNFGFIIPGPTGITYVNQAGGTCCAQPELEGTFFNLHLPGLFIRHNQDETEWSPNRSDPLLDYIGSYDVKLVDKFLKQHPMLNALFRPMLPANATYDFGSPATSRVGGFLAEAWVPVETASQQMVVLVYQNSD